MHLRTFLPILALGLCFGTLACGGDEGISTPVATVAPATPTAPPPATEAMPSATSSPATVPTATPSPTPAPPSATVVLDGDIGAEAIWEPALGLPRFQEACPGSIGPECLTALAMLERNDGAPEEALSFFLEHEAFLFRFQETGTVDFGTVSSPFFNMGRPTAVFLNGEATLLYLGEVVPQDWQSAPGYEDLPDFVIAWPEYSVLREVQVAGARQSFLVALRISECRACQDLGYLNIDVTFVEGSLDRVEVQPMTADLTPTP